MILRTLLKLLVAADLIMAGVVVGHNTNVYSGQDQWIGVTWGTVGGCEAGPLAYNYGWPITGTVTDWVGCWKGISD